MTEIEEEDEGPNRAPAFKPRELRKAKVDSGKALADGWPGLGVALSIALIPLVLDIVVRSIYLTHFRVEPASLAYAGLAISFAAIIRLLSRGDGLGLFFIPLSAAFIEAIIAIIYSGAATTALPDSDRAAIEQLVSHGEGATISKDETLALERLIDGVQLGRPPSDEAAYWLVGIVGGMSLAVLVLYWLPRGRAQYENDAQDQDSQ